MRGRRTDAVLGTNIARIRPQTAAPERLDNADSSGIFPPILPAKSGCELAISSYINLRIGPQRRVQAHVKIEPRVTAFGCRALRSPAQADAHRAPEHQPKFKAAAVGGAVGC